MPRPLKASPPPADATATSLAALGRLVAASRVAAGLRIDDAASLSGVSVDLLSRLENGRSGVSTDRLLKVLDALGLVILVVDKAKLPMLRAALGDPEAPAAR
jgi:transcriptional regulator with XRE-family HTH domain